MGLKTGRRATMWWVRFPGSPNAMTFYFPHAADEAVARARAREWAGVKILPPGTEVWPDVNHFVRKGRRQPFTP